MLDIVVRNTKFCLHVVGKKEEGRLGGKRLAMIIKVITACTRDGNLSKQSSFTLNNKDYI